MLRGPTVGRALLLAAMAFGIAVLFVLLVYVAAIYFLSSGSG
jgi:hypothetical protein